MDPSAFMPNPMLGATLAFGAMLLFASCAIITATAMQRLDTSAGALIAALVNVPLGILLVLAQWLFFGSLRPPTATGVVGFLLAGVFSTYLGRWLFFKSIETAGPTRASSFQTSSPIITAVLGWILLGQNLSPLAMLGIALGVVGLATTSLGSRLSRKAPAPQTPSIDTRAFILIGLGSSAAYAVSQILRASAIQTWNEPLAGVALGAAAGSMALVAVQRKELAPLRRRIAAQPRAAGAYAGVGCLQVMAQALAIAALAHIPASIAALITMCTPLIVLPASFLLFKNREGIGFSVILGMLITLGGVGLTMLHAH